MQSVQLPPSPIAGSHDCMSLTFSVMCCSHYLRETKLTLVRLITLQVVVSLKLVSRRIMSHVQHGLRLGSLCTLGLRLHPRSVDLVNMRIRGLILSLGLEWLTLLWFVVLNPCRMFRWHHKYLEMRMGKLI